MLDADMVPTPDDFVRLLAHSTKMDCVCASYTARKDPPLFYIDWGDVTKQVETNEYGCIPIHGTGLGFTVVTRDIIQELTDRAPRLTFPQYPNEPIPKVFRFDEPDGIARGEDMAFFSDVRALGHSVYLDPHITLGHVGSKVFKASILDWLKRVEGNPHGPN